MGELLLHVEHGSRLARAWLAASSAATNDAERPALHRTTLVEIFDTGVRFSATDSYWTAVAWCGHPEDPGDPIESQPFAAPGRGEVPELVVPVVDHEYRIRDLMAFVKRRTQKVDDEHPDIAITMTITRDRDEIVPTLDPLFDRDRVDVQIPGIEQVAGHVNDVGYPDVARLHWQHDHQDTTDLDQVQLSPELLRKMAKACSSIGSQGVVLGFHGEATKPISWTARKPAAADLSGLLMPQRPVGSDQ